MMVCSHLTNKAIMMVCSHLTNSTLWIPFLLIISRSDVEVTLVLMMVSA